jgi:hypothetical protein
MVTVVGIMSMSLDGFVADPADGVEEVFRWYGAGGDASRSWWCCPARQQAMSWVSSVVAMWQMAEL